MIFLTSFFSNIANSSHLFSRPRPTGGRNETLKVKERDVGVSPSTSRPQTASGDNVEKF